MPTTRTEFDSHDDGQFPIGRRTLLAVLAIGGGLVMVVEFHHLLPGAVALSLVWFVLITGFAGFALFPFVVLLTFAIWATPDEPALKSTNLRRCCGLLLICLAVVATALIFGAYMDNRSAPEGSRLSVGEK